MKPTQVADLTMEMKQGHHSTPAFTTGNLPENGLAPEKLAQLLPLLVGGVPNTPPVPPPAPPPPLTSPVPKTLAEEEPGEPNKVPPPFMEEDEVPNTLGEFW